MTLETQESSIPEHYLTNIETNPKEIYNREERQLVRNMYSQTFMKSIELYKLNLIDEIVSNPELKIEKAPTILASSIKSNRVTFVSDKQDSLMTI